MNTSKAKEKLILFVVLTGGGSNVWTVVWMQKGLIVERLAFLDICSHSADAISPEAVVSGCTLGLLSSIERATALI